MTTDRSESDVGRVRRIPARVPGRVDSLSSLRTVARSMTESGLGAVLVESPLGPLGLITANDVIEAVGSGADPDLVWASEVVRPVPSMVSCEQHPTEVAEQMAAYKLEVVAVVDGDAPVALASALDVLAALLRTTRERAERE